MNYKDCADFSSLKASLKGARPTASEACRRAATEDREKLDNNTYPEDSGKLDNSTYPESAPRSVAEFPDFAPQPDVLDQILPFTQKLTIRCNSQVTCTDFDPTCTSGKLITGSSDGILSFYDFARLQPSPDDPTGPAASRLIQVSSDSSSPIVFVQYKRTGDLILVATKSSPPLLLDAHRGKLRQECCRGDRYVMDQRQVKGHTGAVTCGMFTGQAEFVTGGDDGTVRQWTLGRREQVKAVVLLDKRQSGGFCERPTVGCLDYSQHRLVVGVDDGVVRLYDTRQHSCKALLDTADPGPMSSVIGQDHLVYCRSPQRVTLFDQRSPKQPLCQSPPLTNCDRVGMLRVKDHLITAAINTRKESRLFVLSADALSPKASVECGGGDGDGGRVVSSIGYSSALHQVVVGTLDGQLMVHFDAQSSRKGALLYRPAEKQRSKQAGVFVAPTAAHAAIHTPNALPLFALSQDEAEVLADPLNLRRLRDRLDVKKSSRPDAPVRKEGHDGRLGSGPNASYMRQILAQKAAQTGKRVYFDRDEDPREAVLKYAEVAEREPVFISPAYKETQPEPVLDYAQLEREAEKAAKKTK